MAKFSLQTEFAERIIDAAELRGALAPERMVTVSGAQVSPIVFFKVADVDHWLRVEWPNGLEAVPVVSKVSSAQVREAVL